MVRQRPLSARLRIALTRRDVIVVVGTFAILIILFMIMMPSMANRNTHSPRAVCAANLKGLCTAAYTYASENNNRWPNCAPAKTGEPGGPRITYAPGLIGKNREISDVTLAGRASSGELQMSVTRNIWAMVRLQMSTQKSLVCPDSDDEPNEDADPEKYWDFRKYSEVSYGYQIPFGKHGRPTIDCDQLMPLAADKGPYSKALEAGKRNPGTPTAGTAGTPEKWKPWNSLNHSGEGQNVLFADGHVEWAAKPIVGVKDDNMYTRWSNPTGGFGPSGDDPLVRVHGTPPTGTETPMSDTDTLIYP